MEVTQVCYWLKLSDNRLLILLSLVQPLTPTQVARRTGLSRDSCLHHLWMLKSKGIVRCLNPKTQNNRVYWLSRFGNRCRLEMGGPSNFGRLCREVSGVDWNLYSSICYRHRAAVIGAAQGAMQAVAIKREASRKDPSLRMSANNVRDVLRYLARAEILQKLYLKKQKHPRYELTETGRLFQRLILGAREFGFR